jgi:hypothetical protein
MDNLKIINRSLHSLDVVQKLLEDLKTKPCIVFAEQKNAADLLTQALSDVWMLDTVAGAQQAETAVSEAMADNYVQPQQPTMPEPATETQTSAEQPCEQPYEQPLEQPCEQPADIENEPETTDEYALNKEHELEWDELEWDEEPSVPASPEQKPPPEPAPGQPATWLIDKFFTRDVDAPAIYTPIDSLDDAIGISDKFLFVKELFGNNEKGFTKALVRLDNMSDLAEAQEYYTSAILNDTNKDSHVAKQFGNLLIRRYMSR